jgi:diaminohydroxyphosphoribosylaminopyrimidine deaminase/5-amino-6-(5-phosphoribosylamino)uracil reductase
VTHSRTMRHAIRLGAAQLGRCAPNPAVGCVIVQGERIIGVGATARGGRPHAETIALQMAGADASGATVYVTLEPCAHIGKTGPCAQALIDAGVAHVIIANRDPNPNVSGRGIAMLMDAGINVIEGVEADAASELHAGFFKTILQKRPLVTLKIASSADGKIATASGQSQWITGPKAREYGHALRANHDAILTGIGTVLADDPSLTCRLAGRAKDSPKRFMLDRQGRAPKSAKIHPCTTLNAPLDECLAQLSAQGITRLLVEAGPTLSTAFLREGLADQLYWFKAPLLIGADGRDAIATLPDAPLDAMHRMQLSQRFSLGEDVCEMYRLSRHPELVSGSIPKRC